MRDVCVCVCGRPQRLRARQPRTYLPLLGVGIVLLEALAGHLLGEPRHTREGALPPHGLVVLIPLFLDLRDAGCGVPHGVFIRTREQRLPDGDVCS